MKSEVLKGHRRRRYILLQNLWYTENFNTALQASVDMVINNTE